MVYQIKALAALSGVSTRTLRYYDQIGLLKPGRADENGYRVYGQAEVDRLQQILFFRALGLPLQEIGRVLASPDYDRARAFEDHLQALLNQRTQLELLISNVKKTLQTMKEGTIMTDSEKFEGFKARLVQENREKYGAEVVEKYGREAQESADARVAGMTQADWQTQERLSGELYAQLKAAMETHDPAGEAAQRAAALHRQWLCLFCGDEGYSKAYHRGLAEMYVADPRFTATYEQQAGPGAAAFLRDAILIYAAE